VLKGIAVVSIRVFDQNDSAYQRGAIVPLPKMLRDGTCLVALVGGLLAFGSAAPAWADRTSRRTPVVDSVERVKLSVVNISSEKHSASNNRWPFKPEESQRPKVSGMGTGVIVDPRGFILTNHHVVDKVQGIEVHLFDGTNLPARVVQSDREMDLAVLKVEAGHALIPVTIGSSADLMLGETVITIGNAFGYENTISKGIVSALKRNVTLADDQVYHNLIQTDACINPGNSGGPLINLDGELVGINVATRSGAQGIGFALPIDDVKRVASDMMSTRKLALKWHGLVASEAWQGDDRRVLLTEVQPSSPAEAAGFRAGDQVVKVGELPVTNALDIERGLLDAQPGQPTRVMVRREGREQNLPIDVRALSRGGAALVSNPVAAAPAPTDDAINTVWRTLGLKVTPVNSNYVAAVDFKLHGGLYVQSVQADSPGSRASIRRGDILVGLIIGKRELETVRADDILYVLRQPERAQTQVLPYFIIRDQKVQKGTMSMVDIARAEGAIAR